MNKRKFSLALPALICAAALGAALTSCVTKVPPASPDMDLTPAVMFQRAQDASSAGDYNNALEYYRLFKQKYPEDTARNAWADYEIAFIYYKKKDYTEAARLFDELLDRYKRGEQLPDGPRVLAIKVRAKIEAKLAPKGQEPAS